MLMMTWSCIIYPKSPHKPTGKLLWCPRKTIVRPPPRNCQDKWRIVPLANNFLVFTLHSRYSLLIDRVLYLYNHLVILWNDCTCIQCRKINFRVRTLDSICRKFRPLLNNFNPILYFRKLIKLKIRYIIKLT